MTRPRSPHSHQAAKRRLAGERGSATLELAIAFPAVLLLIFLTVQAGIYWHTRTLALTAAQEGLRAASALHGAEQDGRDDTADFLTRAGADGWLTNRTITADRNTTTATVTVTGRTITLIPGTPGLRVEQHATGPVERPTGP